MIAKEAGVSVMTVSNVINGKYGKVSDKTRERIEAIIEKYNYTPNQNARTLVGAKSRLIGMILNVNEDGYIDNRIIVIRLGCLNHGLESMIIFYW